MTATSVNVTANNSNMTATTIASPDVTTTTILTSTSTHINTSYVTTSNTSNTTQFDEIFLQTAAAQGITGTCTFLALLITCFQVIL